MFELIIQQENCNFVSSDFWFDMLETKAIKIIRIRYQGRGG